MKRTVGWLKKELEKFPEQCLCFAYEGEVSGIVINYERSLKQGFIHLREDGVEKETETVEE